MSSTYLSVDLDYFNEKPLREMTKLFSIMLRRIPPKNILLVETHEDLLPHVLANKPQLLVNVDTHSDFCEDATVASFPHCGNWVNFSKAEKYRWLAPNREVTAYYRIGSWGNKIWAGEGRCDSTEHFFSKKCAHMRNIKDSAIWYGLSRIPWDTVGCVGIAVSLEYTEPHVVREFVDNIYPGLRGEAGISVSMGTETYAEVFLRD